MFKRVQKANADHDKRVKRGEVEEDEGPRELAMDMDSDSDSSDGSESESSSSAASSSEDEKSSKVVKNGKVANTSASKKRKHEEEEESSDEDSGSDSDSDSDEDSDKEEDSSKKDEKPVDPAEYALLRPSIQKAIDEPIFVKPNAIVRQGYTHRSCHLCPQVLIKTEKMIETHLKSGSHQRKAKRYGKEAELLKPEQRKEPSEGGMNIIQLRERVEKKLAKQQEGQRKVRDHAKQMKLEQRRKRAVIKAANRQARKEAKLAKKAVIEAVRNGKPLPLPNKKQKIDGEQKEKKEKKVSAPSADDSSNQLQPKEKKPKSIAKDIIQQKLAVLKQTEKDPRKLTKKYVKKHLLTPAERDELKKVKNQERSQLKFEVRQRKREKKAAAAAASANGAEE